MNLLTKTVIPALALTLSAGAVAADDGYRHREGGSGMGADHGMMDMMMRKHGMMDRGRGMGMMGGAGVPGMGMGMMGPGGMGSAGMMNLLDEDGDGDVTPEEARAVLEGLLAEYDADGDGTLSIDEFETLHSALVRSTMVDRFQHLDADGDGEVTAEEITAPADRMERMRANRAGASRGDDSGQGRTMPGRDRMRDGTMDGRPPMMDGQGSMMDGNRSGMHGGEGN